MSGNKHDNGVHEIGTEEMRNAYQEDTPGQTIEEYIEETQKLLKQQKKKHFSQVFQNPLKGFPYNEEFQVTEIKEEISEASFPSSLIKKAEDIAKKMSGNMTGAYKKIEQLKKGLGDHPKVKTALRLANEDKLPDLDDIDTSLFEIEDLERMEKLHQENADKSLAAKAEKSGVSVGTLRKVYNRGVAAWKTGHRPGTTPEQWGHARVNAFLVKRKKGNLNHDKDLA
jgi:hypothetical protein